MWCFAIIVVLLMFSPCIRAYADSYIHGYFRYTVEDNSVTIIAYNGSEEEVTVPSMIAGNPVNVIGPDVFAKNPYVKVVYLPDCIMEIDETAFSPDQQIIYYSQGPTQSTESSEESNKSESIPEENSNTETTSQDSDGNYESTAPEESSVYTELENSWSDLGLVDKAGNLITVDSEGNLVLVDKDGVEYVLDDTQTYAREYKEDGDIQIVTEDGDQIELADGEEISYVDGNEDLITINTVTGLKTIETENEVITYQVVDNTVWLEEEISESSATVEESGSHIAETSEDGSSEIQKDSDSSTAEIKENSQDSAVITEGSQTGTTNQKTNKNQTVKVVLIIAAVLLAVVVAVAVYLERKRKG